MSTKAKIIGFILAVIVVAVIIYFVIKGNKKASAAVPAVNGAPHPADQTPPSPVKKSGFVTLSPMLTNGTIKLASRYDNYDSAGNLVSSIYYDEKKNMVKISLGGVSTRFTPDQLSAIAKLTVAKVPAASITALKNQYLAINLAANGPDISTFYPILK